MEKIWWGVGGAFLLVVVVVVVVGAGAAGAGARGATASVGRRQKTNAKKHADKTANKCFKKVKEML